MLSWRETLSHPSCGPWCDVGGRLAAVGGEQARGCWPGYRRAAAVPVQSSVGVNFSKQSR